MVLRKPYGFLIKHFRLIHLIITALLGVVLSKYRKVYTFLGECIRDSVNRYDAKMYIDYKIYIYLLICMGLFFLVYWLLKYKDKPRKIYIWGIVGSVVIGIIILLVYSYMSGFSSNVVSQKTIRLYRDILFIGNLWQYYIIIVMLIRGMGFDIKKFNFAKDVQELNLSEEDMEEVEVNIGIDTTNVMRGVRKQKREFGYFLQEYKVYVIAICILIVGILGKMGYDYFSNKYKVYGEGTYVGESKYIKIVNSYYQIDTDSNYVIIDFMAITGGVRDKLNTGNIILNMNGKKYTVDKNICYNFKNYGNCYKQQYIDNSESEYILVYKVDELNRDKAYILYGESYDKTFKIKLNMINNKSD